MLRSLLLLCWAATIVSGKQICGQGLRFHYRRTTTAVVSGNALLRVFRRRWATLSSSLASSSSIFCATFGQRGRKGRGKKCHCCFQNCALATRIDAPSVKFNNYASESFARRHDEADVSVRRSAVFERGYY